MPFASVKSTNACPTCPTTNRRPTQKRCLRPFDGEFYWQKLILFEITAFCRKHRIIPWSIRKIQLIKRSTAWQRGKTITYLGSPHIRGVSARAHFTRSVILWITIKFCGRNHPEFFDPRFCWLLWMIWRACFHRETCWTQFPTIYVCCCYCCCC